MVSVDVKHHVYLLWRPFAPLIPSPRYNRTGWLGVKHQLTYLLTPHPHHAHNDNLHRNWPGRLQIVEEDVGDEGSEDDGDGGGEPLQNVVGVLHHQGDDQPQNGLEQSKT